MRAIRLPARFETFAPISPPIQKKLIAKVKVRASSEVPHPNSVARGDFKMDSINALGSVNAIDAKKDKTTEQKMAKYQAMLGGFPF